MLSTLSYYIRDLFLWNHQTYQICYSHPEFKLVHSERDTGVTIATQKLPTLWAYAGSERGHKESEQLQCSTATEEQSKTVIWWL